MNVWIEDYDSEKRKNRSLKEAQKGGFKTASSLRDAHIVALHESNVEHQIPYSGQSQYEGKLILVYSGGERPTKHDEDVQSRRVLYLMWPVRRYSHIAEFDWIRISRVIVEVDNEYYWSQHEIFPVSIHYLSALTILCQGYLAAHFPEPSRTSGVVEQALQKMGWSKLAASEEGKELAKRAASQRDDTANPMWWMEAFEGIEKRVLKTRLNEEWGDKGMPHELSVFVDSIFGKAELKDAEKVAYTYKQLADNLKDKTS